jgi:Mlc titration factor MtfA (ptsG expression regulator)
VGVPLSSLKPWAEVLERRFGILKKATRRGSRTVMDSYGATNKAEFFAVATETFFEKPRKLREKQPDLYHRLTEFFRMDPAEGYEAPADDGTKLARGRTRAHLGRHRPRTSR